MNVIYWAGDSTVQTNSFLTYPQTGIGQEMGRYLKRNIRIENHARNGRSTKSFLDEGRFDVIADRISAGDFLFIQFGHNDEKKEDPARFTEPGTAYKENLKFMADAAFKKGAFPVLITPLERRKFTEGKLTACAHEPYVKAMKELAEKEGIPLIDLNAMSREALEKAGPEESLGWYMHLPSGKYAAYPEGKEDDTHLQVSGAFFYAGLVAEGLKKLGCRYAGLLAEDDEF
jgi:lysophospholipase L1-like esterase